jgi:hypothetical protein
MSKLLRVLAVGAGTAAFVAVGFASSANAGVQLAAPLTVAKVVNGTAPAGTTFTATIQCNGNIIRTGPSSSSDMVTIHFDATGQPTDADTYGFTDPGQCTVTETAKGGASSTTYACEGNLGTDSGSFAKPSSAQVEEVCQTTGPGPITVNIINEGQSATVTITNSFAAPITAPTTTTTTTPPATKPAAVVTQPTFTG